MPDMDTATVDAKVNSVMATLDKEEKEHEEAPQEITQDTEEAAPERVSGDEETKTNETEKPEGESPIEAPASWPSDDKEAFKSLPTWAQDTIQRREHEREAAFTQRSMEIANRAREVGESERQANEARTRYSAELNRLGEMAAQLMPAKFQDIQSQADFIRLKQTDPARASEFEAFQMMLGNAQAQARQVQQDQAKDVLAREWIALQEKLPEVKDPAKAKPLMDGVRKGAVEYYGFTPKDVEVIGDHRYVVILKDALAWRNYQASVKSAASKKTASASGRTLRPAASSNASLNSDQKTATLNRAKATDDLRKKADMVASLL